MDMNVLGNKICIFQDIGFENGTSNL